MSLNYANRFFCLFLALVAILFSMLNHLCNFGSGHYGAHLCEFLFKLGCHYGSGDHDVFTFCSCSHFVWQSSTIFANLVENIIRNICVKLF